MSLLKRIEQGQGNAPQTPTDEAANKARVTSLTGTPRRSSRSFFPTRYLYRSEDARSESLLAELDPSMDISKVNEVRTTIQELFEQVLSEENIVLSRPERHRLVRTDRCGNPRFWSSAASSWKMRPSPK